MLRWVVGSMCCMEAHWRHLANTIVPSACGCDAALCQVVIIAYQEYDAVDKTLQELFTVSEC